MNTGIKPIKKIAGEVLIYLYDRQRKEAFALSYDAMLRFESVNSQVVLHGAGKFEKVLLHAANSQASDAYNALDYLQGYSFIEFIASHASGGSVTMHNFHVLQPGIDIIEGIEQDDESRHSFNVTFNFKLADNINIEALIKNEVESLIKASIM